MQRGVSVAVASRAIARGARSWASPPGHPPRVARRPVPVRQLRALFGSHPERATGARL